MDAELFVGRRAEVGSLRELLAGVAVGVGGVVLVMGEQGVGKSALLRAGLGGARAAGCEVLWGAADELGQRFPLRLMTECLGAAPVAWVGVAEGGGVLAGDAVLAGVERLLETVDRLCAESQVVLVAEDLQWADEASVLVWHRLSRAVGQLPLLLAGSCRPGPGQEELERLRRGVDGRGGLVVDLGPLGDPEMGDLVRGLAGGRPGPGLAGVVERAGGNPLYARELVDGLVRQGRVRLAEGVAELSAGPVPVRVPVSLAAAIAGRLGWLAADVVEVLRWAAVLGQEFSVTDLGVVTGRSAGELISVVDAAAGAGVVVEAGVRLRFRHGLIRQVLYEGMPAGLRAALHLQAARALDGAKAAPERVAAHVLAGANQQEAAGEPEADPGRLASNVLTRDDTEPTAADAEPVAGRLAPGPGVDMLAAVPADGWVVEWLARAASALIHRAPQVAADLLRGVLGQLPGGDPRREGLQASLVTVTFLLQRYEDVERVGRQALARASDPDLVAEISWLLAYALMWMSRQGDALAELTQALARPGLSEVRAARLRALHAVILIDMKETDQAADVATQALAGAERIGDRFAAAYALHALSTVSWVRRDHAAVIEHIDRALAAIEGDQEITDLRLVLLANKGSELMDLDMLAEAVGTARQALTLAERVGTPRLQLIQTALGVIYFEAGRWDDALTELEPAAGPRGLPYIRVAVRGASALIAGHRDDRPAADEHLRALAGQAIDSGLTQANSHYLLLAQSLAAEQAGRTADALAVLARCLRAGVAEGMPCLYLMLPTLARLALTVGDQAAAVAAADAAEAEAKREPLPFKAAVAQHCRGLVAGDPTPVLAAAGYFESAGRLLGRAQALEDAAVIAAGRGELPAARRALAEATGCYGSLGAAWDIRRAGARLRPYALRPGRHTYRPHPAAGWEALTPTELKVARAVADGRSNPDIAADLFLSRNTVQTHVSHILAKLGARSRVEIAREAIKQQ